MTWNDQLTNLNHVLAGLYLAMTESYRVVDAAGIHDIAEARTAKVEFNYQQDVIGRDLAPVSFSFDPDAAFATSAEDDWTAVCVAGDANAAWGVIPLEVVPLAVDDRVNIIQHPGGGTKQLSFFHNVVTYADAKRVQYLTDTLPGSSGSPVFDRQWRLVAVHHSGGWIPQPGSNKQVYRNEGISIECILDALRERGLFA